MYLAAINVRDITVLRCEAIEANKTISASIYYNQAIIESYLSKSIQPLMLQRSLKGLETISTIPVHSDYSVGRLSTLGVSGELELICIISCFDWPLLSPRPDLSCPIQIAKKDCCRSHRGFRLCNTIF